MPCHAASSTNIPILVTAVAQPQGAVSPSPTVYDAATSPFAVAATMGQPHTGLAVTLDTDDAHAQFGADGPWSTHYRESMLKRTAAVVCPQHP